MRDAARFLRLAERFSSIALHSLKLLLKQLDCKAFATLTMVTAAAICPQIVSSITTPLYCG